MQYTVLFALDNKYICLSSLTLTLSTIKVLVHELGRLKFRASLDFLLHYKITVSTYFADNDMRS